MRNKILVICMATLYLVCASACGVKDNAPSNNAITKEAEKKTSTYDEASIENTIYNSSDIEKYNAEQFIVDSDAQFKDIHDFFNNTGGDNGIPSYVIGYVVDDNKNIVILDYSCYKESQESILKYIKTADNLYFVKSMYTYNELCEQKNVICEEYISDIKNLSTGIRYDEVGIGNSSKVLCISVCIPDKDTYSKYKDILGKKYGAKVKVEQADMTIENQ